MNKQLSPLQEKRSNDSANVSIDKPAKLNLIGRSVFQEGMKKVPPIKPMIGFNNRTIENPNSECEISASSESSKNKNRSRQHQRMSRLLEGRKTQKSVDSKIGTQNLNNF